MLKKNIFFLLIPILASCLKSDHLDHPREINFLETEFYKNSFDDFDFEILEVNLHDTAVSNKDTSYLVGVKYRINPQYLDELYQNWDYKVELVYANKAHKQVITPGRYEYADTLGRYKEGSARMTANLEVLRVFKLIARTTHYETFAVGN